jgi:hypothetical protein
MYDSLGIHWGSSIPAFLALMCAPFPYLFHACGPRVRRYGRYAAESDRVMDELHNKPNKRQATNGIEPIQTDVNKA